MPQISRLTNPNAPDLFDLSSVRNAIGTARHQLRGLCVHYAYAEGGEGLSEPSEAVLRYTDEVQAELARVETAALHMLGIVQRERAPGP